MNFLFSPWLADSTGGFARSRLQELSYRRKYPSWLRFQNGVNPLFPHVLKDALPGCPRFRAALTQVRHDICRFKLFWGLRAA